ncbi:MAG: FAD-dependent monooxygenase [Rhodospirillales bacterium]|nr:FAD-dependent monooxygenase [Rhodospirillales bacterium]
MSGAASRRYDVAIVGAGPVGSLCALAHARKGARVALLEANPKASGRLAGEWLHPPGVRILQDFGIGLDTLPRSAAGKGFVVFPEDGSEPIVLPYLNGSQGLACEHALLVSKLREAVENEADVDFFTHARVNAVEDGQLAYATNGTVHSLDAERIVGADGRASTVRQSLGLSTEPVHCSRMLGITVSDVSLPFEGHGHVLLGGPGPILAYGVANDCVRIIVDVPLDRWTRQDRVGFLTESYATQLPETLRPAFVEAVRAGQFHVAANQLRPRVTYGTPRRVLIGDAAGHYHPMTAVGMTLGFGDALALADGGSFRDFDAGRFRATRVPEMLAMGLYEVFADHRAEAVAMRHAVYRGLRTNSVYRERTTRILACEDRSVIEMGLAFFGTAARAAAVEIPLSYRQFAPRQGLKIFSALTVRLLWLLRWALQLRQSRRQGGQNDERALDSLARALLHSMPPRLDTSGPGRPKDAEAADAGPALRSATARLLSLQGEDGGWEGEMVWCPMLTAQYVLLHHIIGQPLEPGRRRRVLRSFERTRLEGGSWGLHEHSTPHLFVTALVYVAARLLGVERDDPLVEPARRFIQAEGIVSIPSWGKFWLALLNLYDWRGVNAVLPELWSLPRRIPLHPSNWYCHTRLIYMAMAAIYPHRFQTPVTPSIASLREELFPEGFAEVDFSAAHGRLREADLYARPSVWLKAGYKIARVFNRLHGKRLRDRCTEAIVRQIRWELQTTSHTSISPVSGLLNMLALWLRDPNDADLRQALAKLDDWIWEDEEEGARVVGARSASWDSGFALQALVAVPAFDGVGDALRRGADFLLGEQIAASFEGFREAHRTDPRGGWCFAGGWHGWPVSDCTAEAVLGLHAAGRGAAHASALRNAVGFMLRCQNRDGGFGSYEARRSAFGLEWMNPAEMFGDSMTEQSYVECTASCLAALAACTEDVPQIANGAVTGAMSRADAWLRRTQASDGSWRGVWGVQFIYGTLFGIRGLLAAGASPGDPALRLACRWLLERQREDGGWGEHHSGCLTGRYVPHEESQVIQTAWALIALLEAGESNWTAISRGARFLLDTQGADGTWPKQDMAGVFFRTALLDYVLYRQYFPLHALALYEQRRSERLGLATSAPCTTGPPPSPEAALACSQF